MRPVSTLLGGLAAMAMTASAASAEPAARIRGVDDPDLLEYLYAVVGEQTSVPAGPRETHDRAVAAADRVTRALRSRGYYAGEAETVQNDNPLRPTIRVQPGPVFRFSRVTLGFDGDPIPVARRAAEERFTLQAGDPVVLADLLPTERALAESRWLLLGGYCAPGRQGPTPGVCLVLGYPSSVSMSPRS